MTIMNLVKPEQPHQTWTAPSLARHRINMLLKLFGASGENIQCLRPNWHPRVLPRELKTKMSTLWCQWGFFFAWWVKFRHSISFYVSTTDKWTLVKKLKQVKVVFALNSGDKALCENIGNCCIFSACMSCYIQYDCSQYLYSTYIMTFLYCFVIYLKIQ